MFNFVSARQERRYKNMIVLDIRTIILGLFLLCTVVADIILILIRLVKLFICKNVRDCKNGKCFVSVTCKKYDSSLTHEECEELMQLLNGRKKE